MKVATWRISLAILLAFLVLSACSPSPAQPTIDPNAIYTQAAETVAAQLTQEAALLPTSTPTLEPSNTPEPPTATPTLAAPTATLQQIVTMTTAPTQGAAAPSTSSCQTGQSGDKACFAYNVPPDGTVFSGSEQVLFEIGLINAGSTTWNTDYKIVQSGGQPIAMVASVNLTGNVKPGDKGVFDMQIIAPSEAGTYTTYWKFVNPQGAYIYEVYFQYKVK